MTSEKKLIIYRLVIYILLTFVPLTIAVITLNNTLGGLLFDEKLAQSPVTSLVGFLGMMFPAVASVITRLVPKEGWRDSYLRANFKGNMKYYLAAIFIPVIYSCLGGLIAATVYGFAKSGEYSGAEVFSSIILSLEMAVMTAFLGFGEELGWRGYMMPKLEKLFGTPASVLIGGILWGLWHAPLTCSGHNFGTNYAGFPFVGIALMCLMCTLMNCVLTYITKKSKSVYPAAILHMVNNQVGGLFVTLFVNPKTNNIGAFLLTLIPMTVFAAIMFILMLRMKKEEQA